MSSTTSPTKPVVMHLTQQQVAATLNCNVKWVAKHRHEFPNWWRMPGGAVRIPSTDVDALAKRHRVKQ